MKIISAMVEEYITLRGPKQWEIRFITDEGERMSAVTYDTENTAKHYADLAIKIQKANFYGIIDR